MLRTLIPAATVAVVLGALATSTAGARPADTSPSVANTTAAAQDKQDLRSADAIDAATRQKQDMRSADAIDAATRPAPGSQANPRSDAPTQAAPDRGIAWMTIGIGIAGGLLGVGTVAVLAGRRHGRSRARVTA